MPYFSIIIPTRNSEAMLGRCLDSLRAQTFTDYEVLLIDGVSRDKTAEIAQRYADPRIKMFSEPDQGIYDAMNKGVKLAKGEWIYFLGSSDALYHENVLNQIHDVSRATGNKIIFGSVKIEGDTGWANDGVIYDGDFTLGKLFFKNICHQAVFYHRSVFPEVGEFNLLYPVLSDWDFNLRCRSKYQFQYIETIVALFSGGGASTSMRDEKFLSDRWGNIARYFKWQLYKKDFSPVFLDIFVDEMRKNRKGKVSILFLFCVQTLPRKILSRLFSFFPKGRF